MKMYGYPTDVRLFAQDIARGNFYIGINPEFLLNDFCILYIVTFFIRYSPGRIIELKLSFGVRSSSLSPFLKRFLISAIK